MNREKPEKSPADDRAARLGAALRANLRRRKAQSRAKSADNPEKPDDGFEKPGDGAPAPGLQSKSDP